MHPLLSHYDVEHLSGLSPDRTRTVRRVLEQFQGCVEDEDLARVDAGALGRFLAAQMEQGRSPGTVSKHRAIVLAFYEWAYRAGCIEASTLLGLRAIRTPTRGPRETRPQPYNQRQLRALKSTLDARWPKLPWVESEKWLRRVSEGRSPYRRVRSHVIGCQLNAIVVLALHTGLRPREIFALDEPCMHYHNRGVVVRGENGTLDGSCREVPYTEAARDAICAWIECRSFLRPNHERAWLNVHAEPTKHEPMKRHTFDKALATCIGPGWNLKRLRDTCAVSWVRAELPLARLRELLGLARIEEALPYARLVRGSLDGRMEELDETFTDLVEPLRGAA